MVQNNRVLTGGAQGHREKLLCGHHKNRPEEGEGTSATSPGVWQFRLSHLSRVHLDSILVRILLFMGATQLTWLSKASLDDSLYP